MSEWPHHWGIFFMRDSQGLFPQALWVDMVGLGVRKVLGYTVSKHVT